MSIPMYLSIFLLVVDVEAGISGQLQLKVACFHHPSRRDRWGRPCDMFSDCDPHFQFCLTDQDPSAQKCNIGIYTQSFTDAVYLGECADGKTEENFPPVLNFPVSTSNKKLSLVLTINEINRFSGTKNIDELIFPILPGVEPNANATVSPTSIMTKLKIAQRRFTSIDKPLVEIKASFKCSQNRYGPICDVVCEPSKRYVCQKDGSRVCNLGWQGVACDHLNHCELKPCKDWATCKQDNGKFQCICDGRAGPQCQAGFDSCLNNQCVNGGSCVSIKDRPKCLCPKEWFGENCQHRHPCANLNVCSPHGRCKAIGLNSTCICDPGWQGKRCGLKIPTTTTTTTTLTTTTVTTTSAVETTTETTEPTTTSPNTTEAIPSTTPSNNRVILVEKKDSTTIIVIAVLSAVLIGVVIAGSVFFFKRRMRRRRKRQRPIVRGSMTLLSEDRKTSAYESAYDDPDEMILAFDSEIYTEPGRVYSCDPSYTDEVAEITMPPEPPAVPDRPRQPPRSSLDSVTSLNSSRTGVRYVRSTAQ